MPSAVSTSISSSGALVIRPRLVPSAKRHRHLDPDGGNGADRQSGEIGFGGMGFRPPWPDA